MNLLNRHLIWLTFRRTWFRMARTISRVQSPRRVTASLLAMMFIGIYVVNGVYMMSQRDGGDPESLRMWLSGGMILYLIYHATRCAWTRKQADMEYTEAEQLWLGGAPISRATFASYKVIGMMLSALLKTALIVVALAPDVSYIGLLGIGVFAAITLLETTRMIWARIISGLSQRHHVAVKTAMTAIGSATLIALLTQIWLLTPLGSPPPQYAMNVFPALGNVATSNVIQWMSLAWQPAACLATTVTVTPWTVLQAIAAITTVPIAIFLLVRVDQWAADTKLANEKQRLLAGDYRLPTAAEMQWDALPVTSQLMRRIERCVPQRFQDSVALLWRQALSIRRYSGTIAFSFLVPTFLCLSPLLTGSVNNQWIFVIGGIAMCTMMLAPPALRLDFRRDLKRVLLLRGLPVRPIEAVLGQLTLPILITICFQWITLAIAALILHPGWEQFIGWGGMLAALAVFTFALENSVFLVYPHHENAQGFAMVVRANIMFLGKILVIATTIAALLAWVSICRSLWGSEISSSVYLLGAITGTWAAAIGAIMITASCWQRFDLATDLPPE